MFKLDRIKRLDYPYPIIIIEDFFSENFLNQILKEFPKHNQFIKFKKTMVNRRFLSNENPYFFDYIKNSKYWSKFYNNVNSFKFYQKILSLLLKNKSYESKFYEKIYFKEYYKKNKIYFNFSYYLREILQKIPRVKILNFLRKITKNLIYKNKKNNGIFLRFDISSASNGYYRTPHTDSDGTILAFLIYLEDQINIGGTGGDFVINDENSKTIKSIKPKKNKAIFFLSNKSSFHSVTKICNAIGWRKFIYGGFTSTDKKIWSKIKF